MQLDYDFTDRTLVNHAISGLFRVLITMFFNNSGKKSL